MQIYWSLLGQKYSEFRWWDMYVSLKYFQAQGKTNNTEVVIDPLDHSTYFLLDFEKSRRTYGGTTCVKTVITTFRDCESALWINKIKQNREQLTALLSTSAKLMNLYKKK